MARACSASSRARFGLPRAWCRRATLFGGRWPYRDAAHRTVHAVWPGPALPVPGRVSDRQGASVVGNVVEGLWPYRDAARRTARAGWPGPARPVPGRVSGCPSSFSEYARSLSKWAQKGAVIAALLVILDERKFYQPFDLPGLATVKWRVGLKPGETAGLLGRKFQGVIVPFPQMVYLGLKTG